MAKTAFPKVNREDRNNRAFSPVRARMIYINLENALFQSVDEEFHVKATKTSEEIKALLEVGFEYVCEKDGLVYLRKRK